MLVNRAGIIGCTIDQSMPVANQKAVTMSAPLKRPVRFTTEQLKDPDVVAMQLSFIQNELAETTKAARSHPFQAPVVFSNVDCPASGTKITLTHNLNKFAYFMIIGWRGNAVTSSPILVGDQLDSSGVLTDKNTISLRSYVAGQADIMVF